MRILLLFLISILPNPFLFSGDKYVHLVLDENIRFLRTIPGPDSKSLPFKTFQSIEDYLSDARVIDSKSLNEGVTGAQKVLLEKAGIQIHGVFRDIDQNKQRAEMEDGTFIVNFRDDAIFECAAYEISKLLGLRIIPPTVQRKIGRNRGSLQFWIEDCVMEKERIEKQGQPPVPREWLLQNHTMYLFDSLIDNFDRHAGNILVTPDWKMILIDHTRSFTLERKLRQPEKILFVEKDVLVRLKELDKDILNKRLGDYIGPPLIEALLIRRDLLLERFDQLIEERGESVVITDLWY